MNRTATVDQLALFDSEDDRPAYLRTEQPIHVLMPCMLFACGVSMLDRLHRGWVMSTGDEQWATVDCVDCRALGQEAIRAAARRQQGAEE